MLRQLLRQMPKSETHLHIEGALPFELLHCLDPQRFSKPPASWGAEFRFRDFAQFERELLERAFAWFTSAERYHQAAKRLFERLRTEENVRYVETSFASGMIEYAGLDGAEVAAAIAEAAAPGMRVAVFMGIHHNGYHDGSAAFIEASLDWPQLAGIDLHGTETWPLEPWTAGLWRRARDKGKITKAHAGEFCGPDFVRTVVDELGVQRIQHGVRAAEDPHLLDYLRANDVVLDVCPISNLKLGVVESLAAHPLCTLHAEGITCTISTDDPLSFGNCLSDEYFALHRDMQLPFSALIDFARAGLSLADPACPLIASAMDELAQFSRAHARG